MAEWVGREILPHERDLRLWLRSQLYAATDVEDIVQECYCQIARLADVSHIEAPRHYLFSVARNLAHRQRRRARVVRIDSLSDDHSPELASEMPSPERVVAGRQELDRVRAALGTLSDRARRIFVLRRVEGLSQKAIAEMLGVTETIVENDASRSLRTILRLLTRAETDVDQATEVPNARSR